MKKNGVVIVGGVGVGGGSGGGSWKCEYNKNKIGIQNTYTQSYTIKIWNFETKTSQIWG